MRQIKFRAWDKKHKMMWSGKHLFIPIDWESLSILGSLLEGEKFDISYDYIRDDVGVLLKKLPEHGYWNNAQEDLELIEYTGLKDNSKPPKEIFEGDLLKGLPDDPLFEVKYEKGSVYAEEKKEGHTIWLVELLPIKEVIGNKFENPELLK